MNDRVWTKDWFSATAFAVVFAVIAYGILGSKFGGIEHAMYDAGVRGRDATPSDRIAIVAIDDDAIAKLGRWPWPRTQQAQLLNIIQSGGPKVVTNTALYLEAEQSAAQAGVTDLAKFLKKSPLNTQYPAEIPTFGAMLEDGAKRSGETAKISKLYQESSLSTTYEAELAQLNQRVEALSSTSGSPDDTLAAAIANGKTLLPMLFTLGQPQGAPDAPLSEVLQRDALVTVTDQVDARANGDLPIPTESVAAPLADIAAATLGIGHLNVTADDDGSVRQEALVLRHYEAFYPSLALRTAAAALNLKPSDIELHLGEGVAMGGLWLPTNSRLMLSTQYYNPTETGPAFRTDSAYDVIAGKIPAEKYKDKIVLIGTTAAATGDSFATPVDAATTPVVLLAHTISSILQQQYFTRPGYARLLELGLFIAIVGYLGFIVPRLSAGIGAAITTVIVLSLVVSEYLLLTGPGVWLKLCLLAIFAMLGFGFMLLKRFNVTEKLKFASESEGSESNKMLGLAFQGQGQLDMAFEKFKRVKPVDDKLLDLVYNLALDFERKRQFNKAEAVYQFIAEKNKSFKDVQQKLQRAKKLSETVILGSGSSSTTGGGTLIMAGGGTEKPMLGRYSIEKELGKGAMGVVYLGKDPKIGRMVAIKTMALSQEFEADELKSVKERFFREAETAGRLSHPNIVSIFDAGEEHDLAYIAMEFVKGGDLTRFIKTNTLLPIKEVLRLIADAADALDYAHNNGVVHRDIKPANMMLLDEGKVVKIMDFGIARIADSSKTKTGMVLGTPSYMSPEQLSGKKVDGRSDLFSLGVTLYQMLTGSLPFQADSMATLMFKIANEAPAPITDLRPELPAALAALVDCTLAKNLDDRYQCGADLARDLRLQMSEFQ